MTRLWIILGVISFSCSTDKKIDSSFFEISYTERISSEKAARIAEYIDSEQKKSHWLDMVDRIKIDSNFYSYQLYFSGDSLTEKPNPFQALVKLMSDDILDSTQVHVFITDESFSEVRRGYQFSNSSVIYGRFTGETKDAKISIPPRMSPHIGDALLDELRVNEPELFRTGDTLEINIDYKNGDVIVDIYASLDKINIDTLKHQFRDAYCSSLIYDILFIYTPTYINVRDKTTRDVNFVKTNRARP